MVGHFGCSIEWTYDNIKICKSSFLTWIQRSSWFSAEGSHLWILFWLVNLLFMIKGRIWFDSQGMAPFSPKSTSRSKTDNAIQVYFPIPFFQKVINYIAQSSKMTPKGRLSTHLNHAGTVKTAGNLGGRYKNQCAFKISAAEGKFHPSSYTFLYVNCLMKRVRTSVNQCSTFTIDQK